MSNWRLLEGQTAPGDRLRIYFAALEGQICRLSIACGEHSLSQNEFEWKLSQEWPAIDWSGTEHEGLLNAAEDQLKDYLSGQLLEFDLPLRLRGTSFQVSVWRGLTKIPYGETFSYGKLAEMIGAPKAVRAVGSANGKNHHPLIVPCHRVIAAGGKIGGYTGGLGIKKILLSHEAAVLERRGEAKESQRNLAYDSPVLFPLN